MIHVHAGLFPVGLPPRLPAVGASVEVCVHRIDRVGSKWIDEDFLVVGRTSAAVPITRSLGGRGRRGPSGSTATLRAARALRTHAASRTPGCRRTLSTPGT